MSALQKHFKEYLTLTGYFKKQAHLGPAEEVIIKVNEEHNKLLEGLLQKQKKTNKRTIVTTIISIIIMIILAGGISILLIFFIENWNALLTILGSTTALIPLILVQLQRLQRYWSDNAIIDATLGLVDDLPIEEAARVILSLYLNSLSGGEK